MRNESRAQGPAHESAGEATNHQGNTSLPACPCCDVRYIRPNREIRRRLGASAGWLPVHADHCVMRSDFGDDIKSWHVAGRVRSQFKASDRDE